MKFLEKFWNNQTEELKAEIEKLKEKLAQKQDQINKVNSYWKGLIRAKYKRIEYSM